ncbi:tetratricopeptide repeat-containing diguanylate cyclase [Dyella japonica]|uniref:tetratricopeptide repeat-containing diguanylate cyclase n=1 Tax=Dyella japonica TaxID=231455 RepID=UPI0002D5C5B4|nr:GGDEF domain-containing protein [Dyella japonica]
MVRSGRHCRNLLLAACLLPGLWMGAAVAATPPSVEGTEEMLDRADRIKTSNHDEFLKLLGELDQRKNELTLARQWRLRYLDAWQTAYEGRYEQAKPQLTEVINLSGDATLQVRATATLVNILGYGRRYEDAFTRLNMLIDQLPTVKDTEARYQALGEAAQFLAMAGQYDLASGYAQQILDDPALRDHTCQGMSFKLHALYRNGDIKGTDPGFDRGIDACLANKQELFGNEMRADRADYAIKQGRADEALALLQSHYDEVRAYRYPALIASFDTLLARAYWERGDLAQARKYANATLDDSVRDEYAQSRSQAYQVLYNVENRLGNVQAALDYHEKYMDADKGYLTDVTARALAYQTVRQQLLANKVQVDALNKQNEILQLQRKLDRKEMETSRLYIALLLTIVASIAFWLLRTKRSQLRFKRLATRDSLTGVHSRQHFVDEVEVALRVSARSTRDACLVLLDLDHFKDVNDTHGHVIGDLVLKRAVAACQHHLRRHDIFGRLGGEEFAVFMPDCSASQARERAERIRQAIAAAPLWGETRHVIISASFGVASTDRSGYDLHQLMIDADNALYQAKRDGRNRVVYGQLGDFIAPIEPTAPANDNAPMGSAASVNRP